MRHMADKLLLCRAVALRGQGWGVSDRGDMRNDMPGKISHPHGTLSLTKKTLFGRVVTVLMTGLSLFVREKKKRRWNEGKAFPTGL